MGIPFSFGFYSAAAAADVVPSKEIQWLVSVFAGIFFSFIVYRLTATFSSRLFAGYRKLTSAGKVEWNNRGFSTFHAIFASFASFYLLILSDLFKDDSQEKHVVNRSSTFSNSVLLFSIGYFLADLAMIIWQFPALGGLEYVLHHGLSMFSIIQSLLSGQAHIYILMVLFSESTTPFVNLRWYLDTAGLKSSAELSFRTDVKAVRLKADKIVVVVENKIYIYNFSDIKLIDSIETAKNPRGLFSLNNDPQTTVLACLAKEVGHVAIQTYDAKNLITFKAHQSQIGSLELDHTGKRVATASEKGTVIRIFDSETGTLLTELRRGSEYAQIFSLAFDVNSKWLACSSDTCTVHIFSLHANKKEGTTNGDENNQVIAKNPKSKFSFLKGFSNYFDSQWSFAQFKVLDHKTRIAFDPEGTSFYIIGFDGNFYKVNFDPLTGGECIKEIEGKLFN